MTDSLSSVAAEERSETSRLSLWKSLEASLYQSQRALLERDLEQLEAAITEQRRLLRAIRADSSSDDPKRTLELQRNFLVHRTPITPTMSALHSAQLRVQSVARVQQALLDRAQRSVQVLSNLIAGPQAAYSPVAERPGIAVHPAASPRARDFSSEEA